MLDLLIRIAENVCGRTLPAEGLTLTHGSPATLCLTCLASIVRHEESSPTRIRTARPIADRRALSQPRGDIHMPTRPNDPWRDADGTPIPLHCRIEQITVRKEHGALPSRLHKRGQVLGHGATRLTVRFDNEDTVVSIRPHLVRVLTTPGGC